MPIKWSAVEVEKVLDEVEGHFKEAEPYLLKAHNAVKRGYGIKNLPEYMRTRLARIEDNLDWKVRERAWQSIQSCRGDIPKDALEAEKKMASYGKQESFA